MAHPTNKNGRASADRSSQSLTHEEALRKIQRLEAKLENAREGTNSLNGHSLLAEVSHELRSPLTGIVKLAELLSEEAVAGQAKRYARLIEESGKQLDSTLTAVLSLAKLDAGETSWKKDRLSVPAEIESIFLTFEPQAHSKGLEYTLTVEEADDPLYAFLNPGALRSVVRNLLSNAIKYTQDGGVYVTIRETVSDDTPMVEIEVADTGAGISESFLPKLFNRFERELETARECPNGTGLGLSLVKQFTEKMGGTVEVRSEKGEGSQIFVRFPRHPDCELTRFQHHPVSLSG